MGLFPRWLAVQLPAPPRRQQRIFGMLSFTLPQRSSRTGLGGFELGSTLLGSTLVPWRLTMLAAGHAGIWAVQRLVRGHVLHMCYRCCLPSGAVQQAGEPAIKGASLPMEWAAQYGTVLGLQRAGGKTMRGRAAGGGRHEDVPSSALPTPGRLQPRRAGLSSLAASQAT